MTDTPTHKKKFNIGNMPLLWKMLLLAVGVHVLLLVGLTPRFLGASDNSPEKIYQQGQEAMDRGDYLMAQEHFRRVLDMQPKPPPVFEKAAQQHALADRMAKQKASQPLTTAPANPAPPTTAPSTPPIPAKQPTPPPTKDSAPEPFIPPELRGK